MTAEYAVPPPGNKKSVYLSISELPNWFSNSKLFLWDKEENVKLNTFVTEYWVQLSYLCLLIV